MPKTAARSSSSSRQQVRSSSTLKVSSDESSDVEELSSLPKYLLPSVLIYLQEVLELDELAGLETHPVWELLKLEAQI